MKRLLPFLAATLAWLGTPALAHLTPGDTPHLHAGDGWGLAAVAAAVALAIWRFRR